MTLAVKVALNSNTTNQPIFPRPPTTFLTCFSSSEWQKYARKKVCINPVSNSQPPGHEYDTLTTEPSELAAFIWVNAKFCLLVNNKQLTSWRNNGEQDLPEQGQEVHNIVWAWG